MAKSQEDLEREKKLEEMARHAEMSKLSNGEDWDYKIRKYNPAVRSTR